MPDKSDAAPTSRTSHGALRIIDLVRPHWKALTLALVAVLGETLTDILDPWPIKIIVNDVLHSKALPGVLGRLVTGVFLQNPRAVPSFAVVAVAGIAIVGAISAQRLSLAEHDKIRTGDGAAGGPDDDEEDESRQCVRHGT